MKKVLIIEDNLQVFKIYEKRLSAEGIEVHHAANGKGGLSLLQKVKPDLLLLDILLPGGVNGFDVLTWLKKDKELSGIPVIVLSSLDAEQKKAMEMGASEYIIKGSMSPEQLVEKMLSYLK